MKTINFALFLMRYHLYMTIKNLFKKKSKRYMLMFLGRYPENFKHGIKPVVDNEHDLRFTFGPASLIVIFNSKQSLKDLNLVFNKVYSEYIDLFYLFDVTENNYGRFCNDLINKNLYDESNVKITNEEKLQKIHFFIGLIHKMRQEIAQEILTHIKLDNDMEQHSNFNEMSMENIDMEQVDVIIDKIKEVGFDNLTEEEKTLYNKIFKK